MWKKGLKFLDEIMSEFSIIKAAIIFLASGITTFVGASTGGSAMFIIPTCIFLGFPVPVAVATTKLSNFFSMLGALVGFSKYKKIDYKLGAIGSVIGCVGAYIGSSLLLIAPPELVKKLMGILMIVLLVISFIKKKVKPEITEEVHWWRKIIGYISIFLSGCIGASFGGQGVLLVYTLTLLFGMEFLRASGTRVIISLTTIAVSLFVYSDAGAIDWRYGAVMAIASLIGTYFGALYSVKKGEGIIERIFDAVVVILSIKLLCT